MMKKTFFCLVIILLGLNVSGQKKSEITSNRIKTIVVYEQKFDKAFSQNQKDSETTYDAYGNTIDEIEYKDGKIDKHTTYQYDSNNNMIKETELNASGKTIKTIVYKYNGNLKTEKTVYDSNNKMKSKKTYQYQKY